MVKQTNLGRAKSEEIDNKLGVLSARKVEEIVEREKKELLDNFLMDQAAPMRKAADQITNNRNKMLSIQEDNNKRVLRLSINKWVDGVIRGDMNKKDYPDIYERYNKILKESMSQNYKAEQLKRLDRELALRFVLNEKLHSSKYIFTRRASYDHVKLRDIMFNSIKDLPQYKDKLETKDVQRDGKAPEYIIKRKEEINAIEDSENKIKTKGESTNTATTVENEDTIENENTANNDTTEEVDDMADIPDIEKNVVYSDQLGGDIDINFSDMKQAIKDSADEKAYSQNSKDYMEAMGKKKKWFGRMLVGAKHALFGDIFRKKKMYGGYLFKRKGKGTYGKMMKDKSNLDINGTWAHLASVHANQDNVETVMTLTQENYPEIYKRISDLAYEYYQGGSSMVESEFSRSFLDLFNPDGKVATSDPIYKDELSGDNGLLDQLKQGSVSIDKCATDVLRAVNDKKAQNKLSLEVTKAVEETLSKNDTPDEAQKTALEKKIADLFKEFTQKNQLIPQLIKDFSKISGESLDSKLSYEEIAKRMVRLSPHMDSLVMIASQSMSNRVRLNIKFLSNGHSTDSIEDTKTSLKRWQNPVAKLGEKMYGKGYRWRRFPTKALVTGGVTAVTGLLTGGVAWAVLGGSIAAGSLAMGKKAAQLKRKKESIEKEYIKNRSNKENFENEKDLMKMKYLETIGNYEDIKSEFDKILSSNSIIDDKDKLVMLLSRVIAGFDHQKKTGHHAFSIDTGKSKSEMDPNDESNYNKAMSDLYRYKELAMKRLQFEDEGITEEEIRNYSIQPKDRGAIKPYNVFKSGYEGDFKSFKKAFRRERRREMAKTGGKTAATYAVMGLVTAGIAEFINSDFHISDLRGGHDSVNTVDTEYGLGQFNSNPDFSNEISDQFSNLPADTTNVRVDYFAGVDGTPASTMGFNMNVVNNQVDEINTLLQNGTFSADTKQSVADAISQSNIDKLVNYAQSHGADEGNSYLFTSRNLEGIYETLKQVNGNEDLDLDFHFDSSESIIGDQSYIPDDRITGVELSPKATKTSTWRAGQGLYNEDNTHKGNYKKDK